jgi:hypothetical protein
VRGGITGLGLVNILAAVADLVGLFASRRTRDDVSIARTQPAEE